MTDKGVWSFDVDTGEFTLADEYADELARIRMESAMAFNETMYSNLAELTAYTVDELREEWHRRVCEEGLSPAEKTDEFIIEAITGEL